MSQAGILLHAKAILFGDCIDKGEPDGKFRIEIIRTFASQSILPFLQLKNVGHELT